MAGNIHHVGLTVRDADRRAAGTTRWRALSATWAGSPRIRGQSRTTPLTPLTAHSEYRVPGGCRIAP